MVAITTVESAHVENFADGEAGVARAKAEILEGLEVGGEAVLNADNRWFDFLDREARGRGARVRAFGCKGADARLTRFAPDHDGATVEAVLDASPLAFRVSQTAPHWAEVSLCALLIMRGLDVPLDLAIDAIEAFAPLEGRGAERRAGPPGRSFTLIDESYNASPSATAAALGALGRRHGRRIAVLTDMLELGSAAERLHASLAEPAEAAGVDLVFCAGPLMKALYRALPEPMRGGWAPDAATLAPEVLTAVREGDVVMVKGSKASKASLVLQALEAL